MKIQSAIITLHNGAQVQGFYRPTCNDLHYIQSGISFYLPADEYRFKLTGDTLKA